jgi:zinc transport system substrate-binding protein
MKRTAARVFAIVFAAGGAAAAPRVAVDIAPLHSLTAQVMAGVGAPDLILPPGASPHDYAMRPSAAAVLSAAEVVIRIGAGLTPWFDKAREALAPDAADLAVAEAPGVTLLPFREGGAFEADGDGHDGHAGPIDPHLLLDPENARAALSAIAGTLSAADPDNAAAYTSNAAAAARDLDGLTAEIDGLLAPVRGRPYLVFHDAYQYFARRFDIPELGSIATGDAARPGAARIARMRLLASGAVCIFAEPQFEPRLISTIAEGTNARVATLDPAGADLTPGPEFYGSLLRNLAADLADCLDEN